MKGYLLLSFLFAVSLGDSIFHRHQLRSPNALCLDGSRGTYYVSEGTGDGRNKMLVYFEGGGWCGGSNLASTLESCYQRSLTDLGSSKNYPETLDFTQGGLLSGDANMNPQYSTWTKVLLKYCDGSGYQGGKTTPISYKGTQLWFRGEFMPVYMFSELDETYGVFTALEDIVITGVQAGGLAAAQWGDQVQIVSQGNVWTIPDSGIFLDSMSVKTGTYAFREKLINLMKLANADIDPPVPDCTDQYQNEKWRCMFVEYIYPYLKVPLFPVNSLYDTSSIANVLGVACIDSYGSLKDCSDSDQHAIDDYKRNLTSVITKIASNQGNGAWGIACAGNGYVNSNIMNNPRFAVPEGSKYNARISIAAWVSRSGQNTYIDTVEWPDNKACAGKQIPKVM